MFHDLECPADLLDLDNYKALNWGLKKEVSFGFGLWALVYKINENKVNIPAAGVKLFTKLSVKHMICLANGELTSLYKKN